MFKPTYLYIKIHNITGLKYFGKTTHKDPSKYKGSGKRWTNHIKKHGYDVTTTIVGLYDNYEECKAEALNFSIQNNIVESDEWANLKLETLDGGWDHIQLEHRLKGFATARARPIEEQEASNKKKARKGKNNGMYGRDRSGSNNPRFGVTLSDEQRQKASQSMKGKTYGVDCNGISHTVKCDDPRFLTGELIHKGIGKVNVKDAQGNNYYIDVDDPRFLSGELIHPNKGRPCKDEVKRKVSEFVSKTKWYNNGIQNRRCIESPGEEWKLGRLKFKS